jgi:dihydroorotase
VKITDDGEVCGGVAILPAVGKSLCIDLFMQNGGNIEALNNFLSRNARKKLRLPAAAWQATYRKEEWTVPSLAHGHGPAGEFEIRPFMRGETCAWQRVDYN